MLPVAAATVLIDSELSLIMIFQVIAGRGSDSRSLDLKFDSVTRDS